MNNARNICNKASVAGVLDTGREDGVIMNIARTVLRSAAGDGMYGTGTRYGSILMQYQLEIDLVLSLIQAEGHDHVRVNTTVSFLKTLGHRLRSLDIRSYRAYMVLAERPAGSILQLDGLCILSFIAMSATPGSEDVTVKALKALQALVR